ncbi:alpha-methylacyl-CoA racemase [Mycolicibacterium phlei]|uniref:Carnitine dehydratase n=1 Tax=Mycolicibacterium phlei DSM 43239 = CCUG 21000 TaxID=1226750 RepID=A0A5N5UYM3_MYCPH|nr:CaiB/BaiF CoA-transferase family protein [Mycolicibacterium phlei]VEG11957.1 alpha-methylacyl-CoA racemase [Mycobacteroides chelonae]AMO63868.1 Succinyl-CoA:(R)-benzylsuccinate CoA-transferase subunit BbsF [Mycolicibacterium phlei]KAB7754742.1 carnitine dehydratase [Mycolicibacterium phlei DSM 43239 = CCUG 21000]KXW65387.1 carnitine dehydratase [Mycolicibacterium phlei DSM 43239 = CCUG 21000]KXW69499.1 hypothetical protein MPHL43070_18750 [Mycolicibacterium phlei DSM 43070]
MKPGPLNGIRILDVSWVGVGCIATWLLADLGAEVIKIEPVNGSDNLRTLAPHVDGVGINHLVFDRYKKSLPLDLRTEAGREAFRAVADTADAVIEGMRTGVADRLEIGASALRARNPRLTYITLPGYGSGGPLSSVAGHDINFDAVAGLLSLTWPGPAGPPMVQASDYFGATLAALATITGVLQARQSGEGLAAESSLFDGALFSMVIPQAQRLMLGVDFGPTVHPLIGMWACYSVYECADGKSVAVGALEPHFWKRFCEVTGLDDQGAQYDPKRQDWLREQIANLMRTRTRDEWVEVFGTEDVCASPVLTIAEALDHPHVRARGNITKVSHPSGAVLEAPAGPLRFDSPSAAAEPAQVPHLGEGARELLAEVGYTDERIDQLIDEGAVYAPRRGDGE